MEDDRNSRKRDERGDPRKVSQNLDINLFLFITNGLACYVQFCLIILFQIFLVFFVLSTCYMHRV